MIDFPASPVAGQIFFASNGAVYQYNSTYTAWVQIASSVLQDATFFVQGTGAVWAPAATGGFETANPGTVLVGNAGGWYNTTTGVFTPPAGRYFIFAQLEFFSSSSNMLGQLRIRKNGAALTNIDTAQNTAGTSLYGLVTIQGIIEANGTDTFEVQVQCNVLMSVAIGSMGAYPLSQQSLAGGSSWRQIARTVVGAPQATIDFQNIPSDINDIELRFDITPVTNVENLGLQFYDGAGALVVTNYSYGISVASSTTAAGVAPVTNSSTGIAYTAGIILDYGATGAFLGNVTGMRGRGTVNNIRDATRLKSFNWQGDYIDNVPTALRLATGGGANSAVMALTGLRLLMGTGGNFAAGSTATLWGSP